MCVAKRKLSETSKIRYISKFTAASHSCPCDSTAFLYVFDNLVTVW